MSVLTTSSMTLQCDPQLPDMFLQANPMTMNLQTLLTSLKSLSSAVDKKNLEAEWKPVISLMGVMKSSLKTALDKVKKLSKDRQVREEKAKRAQSAAEEKKIQAETKKRQSEDKKRASAAEKQGKVVSIFHIDLTKMGVRNIEHSSPSSADQLDFTKPFILKQDCSLLEGLPALQSLQG